MLTRTISFLLIVLFATFDLKGEPRLLRLDGNSGLSNNYINGIAQDRHGFVWIATESGLNRFDGTSFTTFYSGDLGLATDEYNRIATDRNSNALWICTQRRGIDRLDCDNYTVRHWDDGEGDDRLASNGITDICPGIDGKLWVSTYMSGLDLLDPESNKVRHFNSSTIKNWPDDGLWTVTEAPDGKLYLGHVDAGFSVFDPKSGSVENYRHRPGDPASLPGNQVRSVLVDSHGNIWAGTNHGLALYNMSDKTFTVFRHDSNRKSSIVSDNIYHLSQSSDGTIWIATENGGVSTLNIRHAFLHSPDEVEFVNYSAEPNDGIYLSNKTVHIVFEDSFGNIWLGTYGDGADVLCHRPRPLSHRHKGSYCGALSDNSVMSLCTVGDTIYAGTDDGGLDVLVHGRKIKNYNSSNSTLSDNSVLALMNDTRGNLWTGTYGGDVVRIDKSGKLHHYEIDSIIDVRCFTEKADGSILIGSGHGIVEIAPDGSIEVLYQTRDDIHEEWIRSIAELPGGDIWVGSFGYGISIFDSNFRFKKKVSVSTGLYSNTINQLMPWTDRYIAAATGDGLAILDHNGNVHSIMTKRHGLASKAVRALAIDSSGKLWLTTSAGISVLDTDLKLSNFSTVHEIGDPDFYGGSAATGPDDTIFFGSHRGLYSFLPYVLTDTLSLPEPEITMLTVYGPPGSDDIKLYPGGGKYEFSHDRNTLLVKFALPDASVARNVNWIYNVEGIDNRWYTASPEEGILLRNLQPGHYRMVIKAKLPNQSDCTVAVLPFDIKPPLWATLWAKIIYTLIALAVGIAVIRFYKKRLNLEYALALERRNSSKELELHAERMRFFTNITHELRTPLTLILGPLDDMKSDPELSAHNSDMLNMIHKSASRLLQLINTILEFRKTETQNRSLKVGNGDISELVREAGERYRSLNSNPKLKIDTDIEPGDYTMCYDPEVVGIIIDNLMSNACKYTVSGSVTLGLRHTSESGVPFTEISVADTGLGMDSETISHIFDRYYRNGNTGGRLGTGIGLALVYNLVELHKGEIFVDSRPGEGSVFRFRLQTSNIYSGAPRLQAGNADITNEAPGKTAAAEEPEEKPRVLVIDDNIDILSYISNSLSENYIVETATDGSDGINKTVSFAPDLIVTDVMMPKMSGTDMISQLRNNPDTSHIPVVVVTAKIADEARIEAYECGADSYITKPFSTKVLKARINNILAARHAMAERLLDSALPENTAKNTDGKTSDKLDNTDNTIVSSLTEADNRFLEKVYAIINSELAGEKLDVGLIADQMCMSHSTLYRKIRAITGMSVARLIRKCRARKAAELMLSGKHTISEIAMLVGMGSLGNFRQCFREEFGTTPSLYLRDKRGEEQ